MANVSEQPQNLTKRTPTKMLTPWCDTCGKTVDSWLYHQSGHVDGTPLVVINCHSATHTFGVSPVLAPFFRQQIQDRFLSGIEQMVLRKDGTYNGPTEPTEKQPSAGHDSGGSGRADPSGSETKAVRPPRDRPKDLTEL